MTARARRLGDEHSPNFDGAPLAHGGRIDEARRLYPDAPQPWIDLSTGINPSAYPLPAIPDDAWTRLPDADALKALEAAAARAYRVPAQARVVAGPGAQAFIQWTPRLVAARLVAVRGFTYAEHAANWLAAGADVLTAETFDELVDGDVAVIVNPNNPDGRVTQPEQLAELGAHMAQRGGLLIVDESFMDMTPEHSVVPLMAAGDGLLVLRSFGKAYGLPGLRLGFAIGSEPLTRRLRAALGPWAVCGPALAVGAAALADGAWLEASAARLGHAGERLDALLRAAGFRIVGGAALFRLAAREDAADCFARLCARGVLTRRFPERPSWLRFGLPGSEAAWARLAHALERRHER
jgi:cobalamin biosynthetic protein CobC